MRSYSVQGAGSPGLRRSRASSVLCSSLGGRPKRCVRSISACRASTAAYQGARSRELHGSGLVGSSIGLVCLSARKARQSRQAAACPRCSWQSPGVPVGSAGGVTIEASSSSISRRSAASVQVWPVRTRPISAGISHGRGGRRACRRAVVNFCAVSHGTDLSGNNGGGTACWAPLRPSKDGEG